MRVSELRHRITLLKQQTSVNAGGERLAEWTQVKKLWANITYLSVKDVLASQAAGSQITARCVVRYTKDITSDMRIIYQDHVFAIVGQPIPDPKTGREYLTLMLQSASYE
ncbi:phage head closure protein [Moraxella sp. VT-16-12]|uniref:phage head closure protein n=1 Tax=Moraxella sp. VT-16-12 TaxID=2014877 RepID=UPI0021056391|nr:phage head closure protein [Moraxella sp. VT-16-12]